MEIKKAKTAKDAKEEFPLPRLLLDITIFILGINKA